MSELTFRSAGVSARTIDQTGATNVEPQGIPAGVIGTSAKGPAFVPTTVATGQDFNIKFGIATDEAYNGPLAVTEWLASQQSATFTRVLGIGEGTRRRTSGIRIGTVPGAGFVVGSELPQASLGGAYGPNPYANLGGIPGRTHYLCCYMSDSAGSSVISDTNAVITNASTNMVRGIILAPSGVLLQLSSSFTPGNTPSPTDVAGTNYSGSPTGSVYLSEGRQEFVMVLNGHKGTDPQYPNVLTGSFDVTAPNYFVNVFNTDPLKIEQAGHLVYAEYPIHPSLAYVTGSGIVNASSGSSYLGGYEQVAMLLTGSMIRNSASLVVPNLENFEDRFTYAKTPWIISQDLGGTAKNLFRIHAKDAGSYPNNRIKFSIENITPGTDARPYGVFDLVVREMTDTDKNKVVLEAFRGITLDPTSDKYIGKAIGDTNTYYNFEASEDRQNLATEGFYPSLSNFIRVEIDQQVETGEMDVTALPFGFRGHAHLVTNKSVFVAPSVDVDMYSALYYENGSTASLNYVIPYEPPVPFRQNIRIGASPNESADKGLYWGVQFTRKTSPTETNASTVQESMIATYAKYFPSWSPSSTFAEYLLGNGNNVNAVIGGNNEIDIDLNISSDDFNDNKFSLSNIKILRTESTDVANTNLLSQWEYVRDGQITTSGSYRALATSDLTDASVRQVSKFSFYLQGGYDGTNIMNQGMDNLTNNAIIEEMNNTNRGLSNGPTVKAYDKAIDLMADTTEVDVQLLAIPGISNSIITDKALLTTEARFDAVYLMDIEAYDTSNFVVSGSSQVTSIRYTANNFRNRGVNSSFGAAYFPEVNLRDTAAGAVRTVAPSVAVLGAFGLNDAIGHPWFAPAGFSRGALKSVTNSALALSRTNMDTLQDVNINPLVSFAGSDGVTVWGQKTLLSTESAFERVNVRRLLIDIRRKVKKVADRIVFEQNRADTLARFEQLVRPILKNVQDQNGLERYLVKIDTETTTEADVQNKTVRGKIYVVPTKTLEFLSVDFVLTNQGAF